MPEPGIAIWILGLPFVLAIVELIRTYGLIRRSSNRERGAWSRATMVGGATPVPGRPAPGAASAGRPSTLAPGLR